MQKVFATDVALVLPDLGMDHVMNLQLGFVDELQVAAIALDVFEVVLQVVVDLHDRFGVGFSTQFAGVDFILAWLLGYGVMPTPVFVWLVVCIGVVNSLMQA